MAPGLPTATRRPGASYARTSAKLPRQTHRGGKFRDLAFHFFGRVDWSHKVTSYSELFRYAGQVRTPVIE